MVNASLNFALKNLDPTHPYLPGLGFSDAAIRALRLRVLQSWVDEGTRSQYRSITTNGELVGYAGRVVDDSIIDETHPRYRLPSDREHDGVRSAFRKSALLYNAHRCTPANTIVVVEGFTAVWWLTQGGISNVVAVIWARRARRSTRSSSSPLVGVNGMNFLLPDGDNGGRLMAESATSSACAACICSLPDT